VCSIPDDGDKSIGTMTNEESRYGPDSVQAVPGDDKCPLDSCGVAALCVLALVSAALPSLRFSSSFACKT